MNKVNRIGEIILVIFGILVSIVGLFVRPIYGAIFKNPEILSDIENDLANEGFGVQEITESIAVLDYLSTYLTVVAGISIVIGIIAIFLLIGDKKAKAAGILLIVGAVLILVSSIGAGFFAFVFYLIAGIIALVRKAKPEEIEDPFLEDN